MRNAGEMSGGKASERGRNHSEVMRGEGRLTQEKGPAQKVGRRPDSGETFSEEEPLEANERKRKGKSNRAREEAPRRATKNAKGRKEGTSRI